MEPRIEVCRITEEKWKNIISVVYDDGSVEERLSCYYPDELYFSEDEFVGLTRQEALDYVSYKDKLYLQTIAI